MEYSDVKTPVDLYLFMKENIKYGFYSTYDNDTHRRVDMNDDMLYELLLFHSYYLQSPKELLISKHGICFDQVEFERDWFVKKGYEVYTFFTPHHNHCFLVFKDENGYNWFERTIKELNGIHTKKSLEELLYHYKYVQGNMNLKLYEYDSVTFGVDVCNFIDSITKNDKLGTKLVLKIDKKYNVIHN